MSSNPEWPTPHTVQYWEYTPGGPDPHRDPPSFSPALDDPGTPIPVYGWAIPSTTSPNLAGHPDRVSADADLSVPPTFTPTPRSLIALGAGRFEVLGVVQDYNHGPFDWQPGNVVTLRKVDG